MHLASHAGAGVRANVPSQAQAFPRHALKYLRWLAYDTDEWSGWSVCKSITQE